jgi:hypothetical protein
MVYQTSVLEKVTEFIKEDKMFTSVDIANAVKADGLWVRNREVRDWLQENFSNKTIFLNYTISQILVCNGSTAASLYHPVLLNPDDYVDRDLHPLTPDEVKAIAKAKIGTVKDSAAPDLNVMLGNSSDDEEDVDDDIEMSIIIRSVDRIKIPGAMIRALGWVPKQTIDPALILTTSVISGDLTVNDDYRVSIPRSALPWGTDPVLVMLKGNKIHFKKA